MSQINGAELAIGAREISDLGGLVSLCLSRSLHNVYMRGAMLHGLTVGAAVSENSRPCPSVARYW
jgi:hypothetical protein